MVHAIQADSADEAYRAAVQLFSVDGPACSQESRLGCTLEVPRVAFTISDPRRRYTTTRSPAINPAFAIAEIVWIFTGRNDAAFLNYFNNSLPKFAGDTPTYHGAYGMRLRSKFGIDQLVRAADALRSNKESRQVVLQIWDASSDMPASCGTPVSSDVPCNVTSMLKIRNNQLDWTQILRSNDLFRGVPYNFIQFMTIQEIVAGWIGVEPGCYCHVSDSLHVYEEDISVLSQIGPDTPTYPSGRFNLPYEETMESISSIATQIDSLIGRPSSGLKFAHLIDASKLPICYRDMLCVLFAEVARRAGDSEQVEAITKRCHCETLVFLMKNWHDRLRTTRVTACGNS
jgi:thymidylate synthase